MNQCFKTNCECYSITKTRFREFDLRLFEQQPAGTADMNYFDDSATPWTELGDGIRRKIIGHTDQLMSVLMEFDKGAVGTPHAHDTHDQIGFVVAGAFEAVVHGERRVLRAGDAFIAPHHHQHGVVALEDKSRLLDQFSPRRDDYLPPAA